jgi:hypothetical protein
VNSGEAVDLDNLDRHPGEVAWLDVFGDLDPWHLAAAQSDTVAEALADAVEVFLIAEAKIAAEQVADVVTLPAFPAADDAVEIAA